MCSLSRIDWKSKGTEGAMEGRTNRAGNGSNSSKQLLFRGLVGLSGVDDDFHCLLLQDVAPSSAVNASSFQFPPSSTDTTGSEKYASFPPSPMTPHGDNVDAVDDFLLPTVKRKNACHNSNDELLRPVAALEETAKSIATDNVVTYQPACCPLLHWIENDSDSCKCSPASIIQLVFVLNILC